MSSFFISRHASGQAPETDTAKGTVVAEDDASSAVQQQSATQDLLPAWTASDLDMFFGKDPATKEIFCQKSLCVPAAPPHKLGSKT